MYSQPFELPNTQFILEKLVYFPMRNFNPQPLRPYSFTATNEAIDTISRRFNDSKSGMITPDMLSGVASGIVQPSAVCYESMVNKDFVSTRRFLFMLKVRHSNYQGIENKTYLFGYTEYDGITPNGTIDMTMPHFINNVVETTVMVFTTPLGVVKTEKLKNFYGAIYSNGGYNTPDLFTQRPTDIYKAVEVLNTNDAMGGGRNSDITMHHSASMITPHSNNVVASTTENNISTEYLARLLTSGLQSYQAKEIHVNSTYSITETDSSSRYFQEASMGETDFVRYLSMKSGNQSVNPRFTMAALMSMDHTIADRAEIYNLTSDFSSPVLNQTPDVGDHWGGQDMLTIKAYSIIENCISLATKYGFTKLSIRATNTEGPLRENRIGILTFASFLGIGEQDLNMLLEIFKHRFDVEIFMNETDSGTIPMSVECHVNLLGASKIFLQWGGYAGNWFTVPTFASSLYSPVITLSQDSLDSAASQIQGVLSTLIDAKPRFAF